MKSGILVPMPEHTLYVAPASAPCRAVLLHLQLVADVFGPLEVVAVDLGNDEHKDPAFLRRNPLHTVPTLVTPWGPLWESRTIMRYIESMLPEDVSTVHGTRLYPTGVYARAVVDRLLDWDLGTLYRVVSNVVYPQIFEGAPLDQSLLPKLDAATRFLDTKQLGDGRPFLCGRHPTIADFSCAATLSLLRLIKLEVDDVPRLTAWQKNVAELPGHADIDVPFQAWCDQINWGAAPAPEPTSEPEGEQAAQ